MKDQVQRAVPQVAHDATADAKRPALAIKGVSKAFSGVKALTGVSFECYPGEVHAIVGENGSGKSTLIKIAAGVLSPDEGTIEINGRKMTKSSPVTARQLGLLTAYQDTSLVADLTVAENILLSFQGARGVPLRARARYAEDLVANFDLPFSLRDRVGALGPGARQLLEVVRVMAHDPKVIVLDEPTAALDHRAAEALGKMIRHSVRRGAAVVYVSHRLEEIRRLATRITVIRDGVVQGTYDHGHWDGNEIVSLMVGAPTDLVFPEKPRIGPGNRAILEVKDLAGEGFGTVSLDVKAGEIVGIAGAEGNGQRQVMRALVGFGRKSGTVRVSGRPIGTKSAARALTQGMNFQSGDRANESIFPAVSVMHNATMQLRGNAGPLGLSLPSRLRPMYLDVSKELGIASAGPEQPVENLSGGNQQKVVLARTILHSPDIIVIDEPTQGVDARARLDIYRLLNEHALRGSAVLVNSSDSAELAGLCNRVYIMSDGEIAGEMTGDLTESAIVDAFVNHERTSVYSDVQPAARSRGAAGWLQGISLGSRTPLLVLAGLILAVCAYTATRSSVFLTHGNITDLLIAIMPLAIVALGQQTALISGGFDISTGSMMSLAVVLASMTMTGTGGGLLVGLCVVLAAGVAVGGFNSFIVRGLRVNPIVATIGTLGMVQGVAIILRPAPAGVISSSLSSALSLGIGPVPDAFIVLVVVAAAVEAWLLLSWRGLAMRAAGFNQQAAFRLGLPVERIRSVAFIVCAVAAALAGVFLAVQVGVGSNAVGVGYPLPMFAACFLGGAALSGGRGSYVGALLGALFLTLLTNVAPLLAIPAAAAQIAVGFLILAAVAAYRTRSSRLVSGRCRGVPDSSKRRRTVMEDIRVESVIGMRCQLGESPVWDVREQRIYYVDSLQGLLFRCGATGEEFERFEVGALIGSFALREDGGAILATARGIESFDFGTGRCELILDPEGENSRTRLNDGKVDRQGRFVFGSLITAEGAQASLFRLDPDLSVHQLITRMGAVNGPCWSPDGATFYVTDSLDADRAMWAFDYDARTGDISSKRTYSTVTGERIVVADGATVDAEGFVWSARYNASCVVRLAPTGEVDRIVDLPVRTVTSMAFGGPDLDTLFVTSSWNVFMPEGSTERAGDYAGELIAVRGLGVQGVPERRFAG